jgi:hypothetical protein
VVGGVEIRELEGADGGDRIEQHAYALSESHGPGWLSPGHANVSR